MHIIAILNSKIIDFDCIVQESTNPYTYKLLTSMDYLIINNNNFKNFIFLKGKYKKNAKKICDNNIILKENKFIYP